MRRERDDSDLPECSGDANLLHSGSHLVMMFVDAQITASWHLIGNAAAFCLLTNKYIGQKGPRQSGRLQCREKVVATWQIHASLSSLLHSPSPAHTACQYFFFFFSAHNVGLCLLSLCGRFDFVISQSLLSLLMPFLHLARFQWFSFLQSINNKTLGDFSMSGFGSSQASWHISSDSSPLLGATCASQGEKINTYCAVNLITYEGP